MIYMPPWLGKYFWVNFDFSEKCWKFLLNMLKSKARVDGVFTTFTADSLLGPSKRTQQW